MTFFMWIYGDILWISQIIKLMVFFLVSYYGGCLEPL